MLKPFIRKESRILLETPIFRLRVDEASHPRTGRVGAYYVLEPPDWVNIIAETVEGEFILVRQWRHGAGDFALELPAGALEKGESPLEAAARELREETGYQAERLSLLGQVAPNSAFQQNRGFSVLAEGCRRVGETSFDEGEDIELVLLPYQDMIARLRDGTVQNSMGLCAFLFWLDRQGRIDWNRAPGNARG
jgi:ADP-ribose pyrophosphatase